MCGRSWCEGVVGETPPCWVWLQIEAVAQVQSRVHPFPVYRRSHWTPQQHTWHPRLSLHRGGREDSVAHEAGPAVNSDGVSEWELRFTAYPEEYPQTIALQGQPLGLVLKNVENVRKKNLQ